MPAFLLGLAAVLAALTPASAQALTNTNNTPFPNSTVIAGANWESARHGAPNNQFGDILPTPWGDDDNLYTLMDDGGTTCPWPAGLWRNSFAQITGGPLNLSFHPHRRHASGRPPGPRFTVIRSLDGSLGTVTTRPGSPWSTTSSTPPRCATGTGAPTVNSRDLAGIAYSTDHGSHWQFPGHAFSGSHRQPELGPMGTGQSSRPTAMSTRSRPSAEFNASQLILGRSRADIADITDPAEVAMGLRAGRPYPSPSPNGQARSPSATPILHLANHLTYPRMAYDPGLHRYLLSFTYSYAAAPPGIWRNGSELVILDAPHPWGPFSFVTRASYFGPSNGYDPAFPVKWISANGQDLWMIWAANFDGCAQGLSCNASYGFNRQRVHLTPVTSATAKTRNRGARIASSEPPAPPAAWRGLAATPPRFQLPRLLGTPHP